MAFTSQMPQVPHLCWYLFTSHLGSPLGCCRWVHVWHATVSTFAFAHSVQGGFNIHPLLRGCWFHPIWLRPKSTFDKKFDSVAANATIPTIYIPTRRPQRSRCECETLILQRKVSSPGVVIDRWSWQHLVGSLFMHAWDESPCLCGFLCGCMLVIHTALFVALSLRQNMRSWALADPLIPDPGAVHGALLLTEGAGFRGKLSVVWSILQMLPSVYIWFNPLVASDSCMINIKSIAQTPNVHDS